MENTTLHNAIAAILAVGVIVKPTLPLFACEPSTASLLINAPMTAEQPPPWVHSSVFARVAGATEEKSHLHPDPLPKELMVTPTWNPVGDATLGPDGNMLGGVITAGPVKIWNRETLS